MAPLEPALVDPIQAGQLSASMFGADPPMFSLNFLAPAFDARGVFTRNTTGRAFNSLGVLASYPIDTPRTEYDPVTFAPIGYRAEGQFQNLLTNSGSLSDWTLSALTTIAADAIAPDGTMTAARFTETAATATGHIINSPAISINGDTIYTFSCFVKPGTRQRMSIALTGGSAFVGGNARARIRFDTLSTLLVGGATSGGVLPAGNGWYRIWVTAYSQSAPSGQGAKLYFTDDSDQISYDGDTGKNAWAWGVQLEVGNMTSYIPTLGTALARAADLATFSPISGWFTAGPGTILSEAIWQVIPDTGGHYVWSLSDTAANNQFGLYKTVTNPQTALAITAAGSPGNLGGLGAKTITQNRIFRHVLAWDGAGAFWDAANGTPGSVVTGVAMPTGLNKLAIGAAQSGGNALNAHVRKFHYWRTAKSLAECRGMSVV